MALLLLFCCSVWLFAIPWTAACQASLSFTISQSLLKLMSIHLILCHPLLLLPSTFPSIRVFPMSQLFVLGGQRIGTSVSASVHPMNIHSWFPLGLTGFICLQSKGLSRVFSSTTIQKHQFFGTQPSFMVQLSQLYVTTEEIIALTLWTFVSKAVTSLLFNMLYTPSRFVIHHLTHDTIWWCPCLELFLRKGVFYEKCVLLTKFC